VNAFVSLASIALGVSAFIWALQLKREALYAQSASMLDPLTGLFNRRGWDILVKRETARSARDATALTVYYMDVDDFKAINDRLGHAAGDDVLIKIGDEIRAAARAHDVVARLGGDEFAVLAGDDGSGLFPHGLLTRWTRAFEAAGIAVSIGYASYSAEHGIEAALRQADEVMYRRKAAAHMRRSKNTAGNVAVDSTLAF